MMIFVLSFIPRDVLAEILDLVESDSEGLPTYSFRQKKICIHLLFELML